MLGDTSGGFAGPKVTWLDPFIMPTSPADELPSTARDGSSCAVHSCPLPSVAPIPESLSWPERRVHSSRVQFSVCGTDRGPSLAREVSKQHAAILDIPLHFPVIATNRRRGRFWIARRTCPGGGNRAWESPATIAPSGRYRARRLGASNHCQSADKLLLRRELS
jgi:hypothetical protein